MFSIFDPLKTAEGAKRFWFFCCIVAIIFGVFFATSINDFIARALFDIGLYFIAYHVNIAILNYRGRKAQIMKEQFKESGEYAMNKNKEELQKRIAKDHVNDIDREELDELLTQAGFAPSSTMSESGPVIGSFMDETIFEWVKLKNLFSNEAEKYVFYAGLASGNPSDIPEIEDKTLALLGHVLYEKV